MSAINFPKSPINIPDHNQNKFHNKKNSATTNITLEMCIDPELNDNPPLQRSDTSTFHPDIYECTNCDSQFVPIIPLDENRCVCCGIITYDAKLVC